jgi:protoheme IX farnesyltransferase
MTVLSRRGVMVADLLELTKPRIVVMVMITAAAGFWLAGPEVWQVMVHFHLLFGTMLIAAGTNALNQVAERDIDARMRRTRNRPLPAGRLDPTVATVFAGGLGVSGALYLATFVNALTAALAAATLVTYVFLYTPLKRRTSLSTLVGGVPGALPIVGGWTAVSGTIDPATIVLFWIMFLWQLPHFLALGWIYRDDYAGAGFSMLSNNDPDGRLTFAHATQYAAALVPVSLLPSFMGIGGTVYFVVALILSSIFLMMSIGALRSRTVANASRLFRFSLLYLPILLFVMVLDHTL